MLTPAQVRAQVTAIRKRMSNGSPPIAIHAHSAWTGPDRLDVGGVEYTVMSCLSDLHVREALFRSETAGHPCILLCSFDAERLGDDVLARLAKRRVFHPQPNEVLAEMFGARVIDSRVLSCKPLVEALMNRSPKDGYRPVSGGSLDVQTAWLALLEVLFESKWDEPSLTGILGWSMDERKVRAFRDLNAPLRGALTDWLVRSRGEAARFMLAALESGVGSELLPLGLLVGLLFQPECRGAPETQLALGRLERFFNHREIDETSANVWVATSEEFLLTAGDRATVRPLLVAFDRLLDQNRVPRLARLSRFSPNGLESRLEAAGLALKDSLRAGGSAAIASAFGALRDVEAHYLAPENGARIRCLGMALRLLAWLKTSETPIPSISLGELADDYLKVGGFVDWARESLEDSDPVGAIRDAYQEIVQQVDQRRGPFEQAFVASFLRWNMDGSPGTALLPIEDVLGEVVAPTVRKHPVLLLVLDGMSVAAFRQLLNDLVRRDWVELEHPKIGLPRPVAAALPSVTEVSRWALLAGRLGKDRRSTEKVEFARNPSLLEVLSNQSKPQLFVKGDLTTGGQLGLAPEVQSTILNRRNRVVAVVVNAMDDLLAAGNQVAVDWGMESIKPLRELLHAARDSERVVLLASDHGHVFDRNSRFVPTEASDPGDRYRAPGGPLGEGEMEFKGRRVHQAMGETGVVCLTKRDSRYQAKKRGYHGGACVQEVLVPLAALRHVATELPQGWEDRPPFQPEWWDLSQFGQSTRPAPVSPLARPVPGRPKPVGELDLFPLGTPAPGSAATDWLAALLASELYREQVRRAARIPRLQEEVPRLLRALDARGGSMLRSALAQELGLPLFRIDGLVQNAGRVLNLDGYEVIAYDRIAETVALHTELLKSQFGIS